MANDNVIKCCGKDDMTWDEFIDFVDKIFNSPKKVDKPKYVAPQTNVKEVNKDANESRWIPMPDMVEEALLSNDIYGEEHEYILYHTIGDQTLSKGTRITFSHVDKAGRVVDGVTDKQLIKLLLMRHKNTDKCYSYLEQAFKALS